MDHSESVQSTSKSVVEGEENQLETAEQSDDKESDYIDPLNEEEEDHDSPYFVKILINKKFLGHIDDLRITDSSDLQGIYQF